MRRQRDVSVKGMGYISTYRRVGMVRSEDFVYHLNCFQPTYRWMDVMKTIIIDAQYGS